ncbi:MAG: LysR family transcriptional regulator [Porticoccaceae bacterium]|nr:LysR family transcriptional regulator [Porticoccaceae bacterium]
MNISVKQLRGFIAIADAGSFAEACEHLHLSQPALSAAIRKMEEAIGGQLFARSTRTVSLTPEGAQFLPVARRLLADWNEGFDDLRGLFALQRGKLSMAAMPSFASNCLPQVVADFGRQYPNININVQDIVMEDVIAAVQSGRVELGVTFASDTEDSLDFQPLFNDRFIAIMPRDHQLADSETLAFSALLDYPLVALNRGSSTRRWTDSAIARAGAQPPKIFEASQLTTVGSMVAAGVGVAVVPALCHQQMQALGAVCRPLVSGGIERQVGIYTRRRHALSSAANRMVELMLMQFE